MPLTLHHGLIVRSEAAGAQVHALRAAVHEDRCLLNVGAPVSPGTPLRVADIVAGLPRLMACLASGHGSPLTLNDTIK